MRESWNNEKIEAYLLEVASTLGHMPSSKDLAKLGKGALTSAVAKYGGFPYWQKKLDLPSSLIARTTGTKVGKKIEDLAAKVLSDMGFKVERQAVKAKYDLLLDGHIRIDVKSGSMHAPAGGYISALAGKVAKCDFYLMATMDENRNPISWYVLPAQEVLIRTITITKNGKYSQYLNNFDLLKQLRASG